MDKLCSLVSNKPSIRNSAQDSNVIEHFESADDPFGESEHMYPAWFHFHTRSMNSIYLAEEIMRGFISRSA